MKRLLFNLKHIKAYLTGAPVFESDYYRQSELTRLVNLFACVDLDQWKGLKVLEVGAGFGHIGAIFSQLGFDVTSTDGRPEHVAHMQKQGRKAFVLDLDTSGVDEAGAFDLILALCRTVGFRTVRHISHAVGNWELGRFDWKLRGTNGWKREGVNLRKMWICGKDSPSPSKIGS